jgi:hypothetical protein
VNLYEEEEYRFGSANHGFGRNYDNRITCEFTHYVYFAKGWTSLPTHFLTNTPKFPLVAAVARAKEVVVKRYSNTGHPNVLTIWKPGDAFEMPQQLTIFSRDVIEIRLLKQNNKHEEQHDDDKGENTDESEKSDGPDEDESSSDEGGSDCTICFSGTREVVMSPCRHCCVCAQCSTNIFNQATKDNTAKKYEETQVARCPFCREKIDSVVPISQWDSTKNGPIINVTAGMDGVYDLLNSLHRHCV